jgi:hypothetical protein
MAVGDYSLKVPVEVTGKEQLQQLWDAMRGVSGATRGLTQDQQAFVTQVRQSSAATGDFGRSLKNVQKDFKGTSEEIRTLAGRVQNYVAQMRAAEAQTNRLQQVAGRLGGRLGGIASGLPGGGFLGSQLVGSLGLSGGAALGLGAGAIGAFAALEISKQVAELGKWAQQQQTAASAIGVTVSQMELLTRVSERTGTNLDGVAKSVTGLREKLIEGGSAADKTREKLSQIGLNGGTAFKNPADAIEDIVHALAKIPDEAQRSQKGFELLGESGRELAAIATTFDSLGKRSGSGVFSQETNDQLISIHQKMEDVKLSWDALLARSVKPITMTLNFVQGIIDATNTPSDGKTPQQRLLGALYPNAPKSKTDADKEQAALASGLAQMHKDAQAKTTADNLKAYDSYKESTGTYQDQKAAQVERLRAQPSDISKDLSDGKITLPQAQKQYSSIERQIKAAQDAAKDAAKREAELRSQKEAFGKLQYPVDTRDTLRQYLERSVTATCISHRWQESRTLPKT